MCAHICLCISPAWASLQFKKDRKNIDSFRRFIGKFSLFSNQSEALITSDGTTYPRAFDIYITHILRFQQRQGRLFRCELQRNRFYQIPLLKRSVLHVRMNTPWKWVAIKGTKFASLPPPPPPTTTNCHIVKTWKVYINTREQLKHETIQSRFEERRTPV